METIKRKISFQNEGLAQLIIKPLYISTGKGSIRLCENVVDNSATKINTLLSETFSLSETPEVIFPFSMADKHIVIINGDVFPLPGKMEMGISIKILMGNSVIFKEEIVNKKSFTTILTMTLEI